MKKLNIITTASILNEFGVNDLTQKKGLKKTIVMPRTVSISDQRKKTKKTRPAIITQNVITAVNTFDDKQTDIVRAIAEGDRKKMREMNLRYKKGYDASMFSQFPGLNEDTLLQYSLLKINSVNIPIIHGLVSGRYLRKRSSPEIARLEKQTKRVLKKFYGILEKLLKN